VVGAEAEAEADHDVRDGIACPIDRDQVDLIQLLQVERSVILPRHEVLLGAVVEIADVVHGHEIAVACRV
jgi:hypothetical protein